MLNNMTQDELATKTELDRSTIIRYENNQVEHSIGIINSIAAALNIFPSIIYDDYLLFLSSDYGGVIKRTREKLKLTQKNFASLLNVHKKTIRTWEHMKSYPSRKNYKKLIKL
ncbi:MAG: helix-turn-helix domain-containing protein [Tissierella sp.]|nr:helix-turn-helix domain-containing protein [Tissierella sp.]